MSTFYVNEHCIGCWACASISPCFQMQADGKAKVIKQPETPDENNWAKDALSMCPVQAIIEE